MTSRIWPTRPPLWLLAMAALLCIACPRNEELPRLGTLPAFQLTNQDGAAFGSRELSGAPYLVAFMFTRCPSICPKVSARMRTIGQAADTLRRPLRLVSISVDGEHDSPPVLTTYAQKHGLLGDRYVMLTGDARSIADFAERHFKVAVSGSIDEGADHLGITHGSHFILVDDEGEIRGYYRSSDEDVVQRLTQDLERF